MLVAKTDMEGQVLWQNDFGGPLTDFGRDVQPFVSQGQTLLLGTTQSFGSGVASIYLVCIDIDVARVIQTSRGLTIISAQYCSAHPAQVIEFSNRACKKRSSVFPWQLWPLYGCATLQRPAQLKMCILVKPTILGLVVSHL